MNKFPLIALLCLALFSPAFAAGDAFNKIDADKSGKIEKNEFSGAVNKSFDKLDKNRNGYLEWDEFKEAGPRELFDELDVNKDGKISREEFTKGAHKHFELLDKDRSGSLDRTEFNAPDLKIENPSRETPTLRPFLNFYF